jgi:hypothetical protein
MKKILVILVIGGICWIASFLPVFAASLSDDPSTAVMQKIKPGSLKLQAPTDVFLPEVSVSTEVQTTAVTALDFLVEDARGYKPPVGWSATVTMSKLASAGTNSEIPFLDPVSGHNDYKLTPKDLVAYSSASVEGVTLGAAEELAESGTSGVSQPKTVMVAAPGFGRGRLGCDLEVELKIPADSYAAEDYVSTLTFTVS